MVGRGVYQRKRATMLDLWKGPKPCDAICAEPFAGCSNDLAKAGHQVTELRGPSRHFF